MSRNGSGTYQLPAGNPVVSGTTISSTVHNSTTSDIADALTQSLSKDGQTTPTANLPMGSFRHTGVGNATARNQYGTVAQIQDGAYEMVGSVAGTDTITGSLSPAITAYAAGMRVTLIPANANTGAATLNLNAVGALDIQKYTSAGQVAIAAGDLRAGIPALLMLDTGGDDWILLNPYSGSLGDVTIGTLTSSAINNSGTVTAGNVTTSGTVTSATINNSGTTTSNVVAATSSLTVAGQSARDATNLFNTGTVPDARLPGANVIRFGAQTGVDCTAAVNSDFVSTGSAYFPQGAWVISSTPTIPAKGTILSAPGSTFSGAGATAIGIDQVTPGGTTVEYNTSANEYATRYIRRNANHTGGTAGFVSAGIRADTFVSTNTGNYEWAVVGMVSVSATSGTGQHVGGYFQGNKSSASVTSPIWGATVEVRETAAINNPTVGTVALEIDHRSNGTDANGNRVLCDAVVTRQTASGTTHCEWGYRIQNGSEGANATIGKGFSLVSGLRVVTAAFDCSAATFTSSSTAAFMKASSHRVYYDAGFNYGLNFSSFDLVLLNSSGRDICKVNGISGGLQLGDSSGTHALIIYPTFASTASAGAAAALPATPQGYININIDGTDRKIPYYPS